MLQNPENIKTKIDSMLKGETIKKSIYDEPFNQHLSSFLEFYKFRNDDISTKKNFRYTEQIYFGIEQKIIESNSTISIDWDIVDEYRYMYKTKLQQILGKEGKSDYLNPFVLFSTNLFEDWLIFEILNNTKKINPWEILLDSITQKGFMFFVSDDQDKLNYYKKDIYNNVNEELYGNLGIIAKSNSGKNSTSGFIVDNRYSSQLLVKDFLYATARGHSNAKSIEKIMEYLRSYNKILNEKDLKNNVLIPLKREGIIGSKVQGYYFIQNLDDVIETYRHHKKSLKGILLTLNSCKEKAKSFNVENLDEWISGKNLF